MRLNKVDKLQFIYNGKQHIIKLKFYGYLFNGVPVFLSENINDYSVILLDDNCIIVVVNSSYSINTNNKHLEIGIFDKLLRYQLCTENDIFIDAHLTRWFSSSDTIKYINSCKISNEHKKKRISFIENTLLGNNNFTVHDKQYVVNNLNFVEINELEK